MNRSIRPSVAAALALCAILALGAGGAYGAGAVFHFQRESMKAFQSQLAAGEIHAATFNKVPHSLHLSMNDHRHLLVVYPPTEYKKIVAQLEAKGVPVAVEKHAKAAAAKPAKHKLRYIAAGILVLVILVVLIVLLVGRRRDLTGEQPEETGGQAPASPPAESG